METLLPAQKIAISGILSIASWIPTIVIFSVLNATFLPIFFLEATKISSVIGMDNSLNTFKTSFPTRPVHPIIANFIL